MEHLVVILNGCVQEIPAALVEVGGIFRVFLVQNAIRFRFISSIAVMVAMRSRLVGSAAICFLNS